MKYTIEKLKEKNILTKDQSDYLHLIISRKLFSVHYELRSGLYMGVLLLTTGIGFLIYENFSNIGHLALIITLIGLTGACAFYVIKNAPVFSKEMVKPPTPYFDYILLLGALVFASTITYILFQANLLEELLNSSTLFTSMAFVGLAFRYDHRGVLSLGLTAFAGYWGLSITPVNWAGNELELISRFNLAGIILGVSYYLISMFLQLRNFKSHFSFTFEFFGLLLFFSGILGAIFNPNWIIYSIVGLAASIYVAINSWKKQQFLFFVTGCLVSYVIITRVLVGLLIDTMDFDSFELILLYFMASTGGFIYMISQIIKAKKPTNDRL